jgi:hypothetical protein
MRASPGSSAMSYTRVLECRLKVALAAVLPVQQLCRRDSVSLFQAGTSRSELSDSGFVRVRKTSTGSSVGHAAAMAQTESL